MKKIFARASSIAMLLASVSLVSATIAYADPFGIAEGMSLDALHHDKDAAISQWSTVVQAPKPNELFAYYYVTSTPDTGVCGLLALGKAYESDRYGEGVRRAFAGLAAALTDVYGKPFREVNVLQPGALYKEPQEWVASIKYNERKYETIWGDAKTPMKDHVVEVWLRVAASSQNQSTIALQYTFSNHVKCEEIMKQSTKDGL